MPTTQPLDEDAICDAIASEVAAAIPAHYSPAFRAQLVGLYVRQFLGLESSIPSQTALADAFGVTQQRISMMESIALARLYKHHSHTLRSEL